LKRSQVFAVSIFALILIAAVPVQQTRAQGAYSEKLVVNIAGADALWFMRFDGVNGSGKLSSLESSPGLSWYNITAIESTGWQSDFQVFGHQGYNLLPVPFVPSEGLFLTVGSDSFSDANAAAGGLGSYLLTSFQSWSNASGTYTFYSPVTFSSVVPVTLLSFLPTKQAGFAAAINPTLFAGTSSPMVTLEGVKASSGFEHSLIVGSITNKGLDAQKRPNIFAYFGTTVASLRASNASTSSSIKVTVLDGVVSSKDSAVVSSVRSPYSGSYSLTISPGKSVSRVNATILQQPVQLLAYRTIDSGVLRTGANVTVTDTLAVLTQAGLVKGINFTDDWWKGSGQFKLVRGNDTFPATIPGGTTVTPVYVLQYTGTSSARITMPPSVVRYSFPIGNSTFQGQAALNPVPLSLGTDDAVVYTYATPSGATGRPVGATQNFTVVAKNAGTVAASSVTIGGKQVPGLADHGGQASVNVSLSSQGIVGINQTKLYTVDYKNGNGVSYESTTNLVQDIFTHATMKIGFPTLSITESLVPTQGGTANLMLTFLTSNGGSANITSFVAQGILPAGLGCGVANGTGIKCAAGAVSLNYSSLAPTGSGRATLKYNVTTPSNFIIRPFGFQTQSSGINMTGWSGSVGVPAGITLSKSFSPAQLFGGMTSDVKVTATNSGPLTIYNATVASGADSFDTVVASANTSRTANALTPGQSTNFSFGVLASDVQGDFQASGVVARFFFEGTLFTISGQGPKVSVFGPLSAAITTTPAAPVEGKSFAILIAVSNPSGADVSNVRLTLPIPPGVSLSQLENATISGGNLTVGFSSAGPHQTLTATAVGIASSGITIRFDKATLTFTYSGVTVSGKLLGQGIAIGEDTTTRYLVPTGLVLLAFLAAALYIRRKSFPSVPASQK
jgi:hypothetical protein